MEQTREALVRIFDDLMPNESLPVPERTRTNCLGWDSLTQLNLMLAIEQEFGITFSDDDGADMNSFEMALIVVQEKLAQLNQ